MNTRLGVYALLDVAANKQNDRLVMATLFGMLGVGFALIALAAAAARSRAA